MVHPIGATTIEIAGSGDIRAIGALHERLSQALQHHDTVVLDLNAMTDPDITLVQLIEAARRHAAATGKSVAIKYPAERELEGVLKRGGFLVRAADRAFWLAREKRA
jgi:hypothetical protein